MQRAKKLVEEPPKPKKPPHHKGKKRPGLRPGGFYHGFYMVFMGKSWETEVLYGFYGKRRFLYGFSSGLYHIYPLETEVLDGFYWENHGKIMGIAGLVNIQKAIEKWP